MSEGKGIMETMEEIIKALSFIGTEHDENPNVIEWVNQEDVSLPLAFAVDFGFATLTDKGAENLRKTYEHAKQIADERGLEDVTDIIYTDTEVPLRTMTITIPEAV
jgi:hypothetical protein